MATRVCLWDIHYIYAYKTQSDDSVTIFTLSCKNDSGILFVLICHCTFVKTSQLRTVYIRVYIYESKQMKCACVKQTKHLG